MEKNKIKLILLLLIIGAATLSACKKDEQEIIRIMPDNRVFIVNEGPFMSGSGSIDIYYRDSMTVVHDAFKGVNGFELGNLVQSLYVHEDRVYIVVNNANRIEVATSGDLISVGSIVGINMPRYFLGIDDKKGYVSSWDNKVYTVDLESLEITGSINVATGPEKMMLAGDKVWVLNQGGLSYDSTVSVIDWKTDQMVKNIVVGDKPSGIVSDASGMIWVMCSGNGWNGFPGDDDTEGRLVCIDPDDLNVIKTFVFPDALNHPEKLVIDNDGQHVYFNYPGGLCKTDILQQTLEITFVMSFTSMYYGLGYDPQEGLVYVTDPRDYVQNGQVIIIDPEKEEVVTSFDAGIIPGEFYFN